MSRVVGMGPISLSNLVNSAPSAFSSGFYSTDIQTVPGSDASAVGAEVGAEGVAKRRNGESMGRSIS